MGLDNREYIREEQKRYGGGGQGGFSFGVPGASGGRSIVIILIIINFVMVFLDAFSPIINAAAVESDPEKYKPIHAISDWLSLSSDAIWQVWTFLTYGFVHAGIDSSLMHVVGNMLALFFLGRAVEQRLGGEEFLKFYLTAIIVGGLVFVISQKIQGTPGSCVGASGAVSAVVALFVFMYPRMTVLLFFVIPMRAWVLGVILVAVDLMSALNPESRVAWEAHLGGAAFGAAYYYFQWNFKWLKTGWIQRMFSNKPSLKVHDPDAKFNKLKSDADKVLEKINEQGEDSLSRSERRTLNKYSKELRNRREN